ncbi:MAG: hypothetical protein ABIK09_09230 [Pseudomonadota bacterium]
MFASKVDSNGPPGHVRVLFLAAVTLTIAACDGGGPEPVLDLGGGLPGVDTIQGVDTPPVTPPVVDIETVGDQLVSISGVGGTIKARFYTPHGCDADDPCPGLVLVPDLGEAGTERYPTDLVKGLAVLTETVIAVYNPPGFGDGAERSAGDEDFGGVRDQDALKDVLDRLADAAGVEEDHMGVLSFGGGLAAAAGAVARFGPTNLTYVDYIIDLEGVTNRCYLSQSPYTIDPGGNHVNTDGPGPTLSRCDFQWFPREVKFPAGTSSNGKGTDGTPNAYICNKFAFPLAEAGSTCADDPWWKEREARTYLPDLEVHYLRLQFLHDHWQPTRYAARETIRWLVQGSRQASFQLNDFAKDAMLAGYTEVQLEGAGAYLAPPGIGNGLGSAIYDDDGNFEAVTPEELLLLVLPKYVERMQKRVK